MLGFVKLMKHRKTANVMLKNDKGECFFLSKEVLSSYFSSQVFVSHSGSGLFFFPFFIFFFIPLALFHKLSHCQKLKDKTQDFTLYA